MPITYANAILKINGVGIKSPQALQWEKEDIDASGSGRNQNGLLFRDRVAVKRKLTCRWPPMESAEMSQLLNAMSPEFFTLEYPDAFDGTQRSGTFYVGPQTAPIYKQNANGTWLWENLSANFIER